MEIQQVSAGEYDRALRKSCPVYLTGPFNELHDEPSGARRYLLFGKDGARLALACVKRDSTLCSPISAPFGGFAKCVHEVRIREYAAAAIALTNYARDAGCSAVSITMPSTIYDPGHVAKTETALTNAGFQAERTELNYHLDLNRLRQNYSDHISHAARKNLKRSRDSELTFRVGGKDDLPVAYEVLRKNRESKGYSLAMSRDQVENTKSIVSGNEYLVCECDEPIAAALVFDVTDRIAQVIYWGHLPGAEAARPVNLLAWKLLEHYSDRGFECLDIGPGSGDDGLPNFGLCDFKESIGCSATLKHTFRRTLP